MGLMYINVEAKPNQKPSRSGYFSISVETGSSHVFTSDNFTTETTPPYLDPEGDEMEAVKILSLQRKGEFKLRGVDVSEGDVITKLELDNGELSYFPDQKEGAYSDSFITFVISDVGSSLFTSSPNKIYINVTETINRQPSSVGDNNVSIEIGSEFTFTRASFTTETTPQYSDPEGNPAYQLRIDSLPLEGKLTLNDVDCYVNQVIDFSDIDLGLLKYKEIDTLGSELSSFNFSVSDSVSQQFTS